MPRSNTHELAWALGLVQGILVQVDSDTLAWFSDRGVKPSDLDNLQIAGRIVASAFYCDPQFPRPKEDQ